MPSILFVCTGNLHRSPLAAAHLRRLLQERGLGGWRVESAGTWTISERGLPLEAVKFAEFRGLDLAGHKTKVVSRDMLNDFDLVLVMERGQKEALQIEFPDVKERVYRLSEMLDGATFDIPDPVLFPAKREQVLDDMLILIDRALPRIVDLGLVHQQGRS
jgi:protein-tyrosine-phosphatase